MCRLFVSSRPAGPLAWRKARKPIGRGLWHGLISRKLKLLLANSQHTHSPNPASNHPSIRPSIQSLTHTSIHSSIHSFTHPSFHAWMDGWIYELVNERLGEWMGE